MPPSPQSQPKIAVIVAILSAIVLGFLWLAIIQNIRGHQGKEPVSAGSGSAGEIDRAGTPPQSSSPMPAPPRPEDTTLAVPPPSGIEAPASPPPPEPLPLQEAPRPEPVPTQHPAVSRAVTPSSLRHKQATRLPAHKGLDPECMAELDKLCPETAAGENRRKCFQEKEGNLSGGCQGQLHAMAVRITEGVQSFKSACEIDIKRFCANIQPGGGRILQCLEDRYQEVSDACYKTLRTKPFRK